MPAKNAITGKAAHNFSPIAPGTRVHCLTVVGYIAVASILSAEKEKDGTTAAATCVEHLNKSAQRISGKAWSKAAVASGGRWAGCACQPRTNCCAR